MKHNVNDIIKALEDGQEVEWTTWVPLNKSEAVEGEDAPRRFWGIASTADLDLQGEVVDTKGLDIDYFKNYGFFNDDHKPGPENKIGRPTKVEIRPEGLYVEGELFKNHQKADAYWELMNSLDKSGVEDRKIGLSIEGKVKRRNGKNVMAAWLKDIAITCSPVNTSCFVEVMKAIAAINKSRTECECKECKEAGKCICKTLSTTSGNALIPESLDSKQRESVSKALQFNEAVEFVVTQLEVDRQMAEVITHFAFNQ